MSPLSFIMNLMGIAIFLGEYITWHYGQALRDIWELGKNFLWFGYYLFSLELLLKTLFAPFYRIREESKGVVALEALLENIVANTVSRVVGFLFRTIVLIIGIIFEGAVIIATTAILAVWIFFPILLPALFFTGLAFIF